MEAYEPSNTTKIRAFFASKGPDVFVSKFQPSPDEIVDSDWTDCSSPAEKRRVAKWEALTDLYFILTSEKYRKRSLDLGAALWKVGNCACIGDNTSLVV